MKGIAKLQLIDPETNQVEEVIEGNYFPNWQNYVLNDNTDIPEIFLNIYDQLKQGNLSLYSQGLRLYGNSLASSGAYLPQLNNDIIGYVSGVYSGDDIKRGTVNELESGEIEGGYRLVFDFGTGIAVGDINAICLVNDRISVFEDTSKSNDLLYRMNNGEGGYYNLVSHRKFSSITSSGATVTGVQNLRFRGKYLEQTYRANTGLVDYNDLWIYRYNKDINSIYYNYSDYMFNNEVPHSKIKITVEEIPIGYTRDDRHFMDDNYLYILHRQEAVGFKIHRYDLDTGLYVDELTYNVDYPAAPQYCFIMEMSNDRMMWANGTTIYIMDLTTLNITTIANANTETILYIEKSEYYGSTIYATVGGTDFTYIDISTGNKYFSFNINHVSSSPEIRTVELHEPLVKISSLKYNNGYNSHYQYSDVSYAILPNVLTTVNNLGSTLTKPTDKVLKVIYDIMET
jgi:hypothetical protein